MGYFRTCPDCGAALDPGEKCECQGVAKIIEEKWNSLTKCNKDNGQLAFNIKHLQVGKLNG